MGSVSAFYPAFNQYSGGQPMSAMPNLKTGSGDEYFKRFRRFNANPANVAPNTSPSAYRSRILSPSASIPLGVPVTLYMQVQNQATGLPLQNLEIVHEKPVHMFLVSRDLSDFQHVHPDVVGPGLLKIPATFKKTGPYSVFTQFKPNREHHQTLTESVQVPGRPMPDQPLRPDATLSKTCYGVDHSGKMQAYTYQLTRLPGALGQPVRFQVQVFKNGRPVPQVEPFLGATGHAILVSANHQAFAHAHAMDNLPPCHRQGMSHHSMNSTPMPNSKAPGVLNFESEDVLSQPGLYKLWVQTQVDGRVKTIDWTLPVGQPYGAKTL